MFHNKEAEMRLAVHGDDFTFSGPRKELERIRRKMRRNGMRSRIVASWGAVMVKSRR